MCKFVKFALVVFYITASKRVSGLPPFCYNYYTEFELDEDYNPNIYPEVNTKITDITTLYKVSEVSIGKIYHTLTRYY